MRNAVTRIRPRDVFGPFYGHRDDWITRSIKRNGTYEPGTTALLCSAGGRGKVLWDIGAHVGYFSRSVRGFSEIHAWEVDPVNAAVLLRNSKEWPAITVHSHGFGPEPALLGWRRVAGNSGMTHAVAEAKPDFYAYAGPPSVAMKAPDAIKLDVQGHEATALRALDDAGWLYKGPLVLFEQFANQDEAAVLLEDLGYQVYVYDKNVAQPGLTKATRDARERMFMAEHPLGVRRRGSQ